MLPQKIVFYGAFVHAPTPGVVEFVKDCLLIVGQDGKIESTQPNTEHHEISHLLEQSGLTELHPVKYLQYHEFLIPGFVDTHNHAPQFAQRGLGQGLHILDWLSELTFPNEAKFADVLYAKRIYTKCVEGFLKQGITCASYYGSLHGPATKILAEICLEKGQRALVGKCNMNRNSPDYYVEKSAQESLEATEEFISHVKQLDMHYDLVKPVITPRFAISCDAELLEGLGRLASKQSLPIQTHFNEAQQEIDATLELFPQFANEADLYDHFGLLTPQTILAHCTIMASDYEIDRLQELHCGIAHCPIANTTVGGGFMAAPIREFLRRGMNVGLGTDSGGGFSSSILDALRQALIVSNAQEVFTSGAHPALTLNELFYMATMGGASVCNLDERIGTLEIGKDFDALVITGDPTSSSSHTTIDQGVMTMIEEQDSLQIIFEKFLVSGDDRNIIEVYVQGRQVR